MIHRVLRMLKHYGFTQVVINVHHLGEQIMKSVGDGSAFGINVSYSIESNILGTGGGIKAAEKFLGNEPFLVLNSDILFDIDLNHLQISHSKRKPAATLVVRDDPSNDGYGGIKIDGDGRVRDILGLVDKSPALKPRLFTGIQILDPIFFSYLQAGKWASSTQDVFPKMTKDNLFIDSYEHSGYFLDLGTAERYAKADNDIKYNKFRFPY